MELKLENKSLLEKYIYSDMLTQFPAEELKSYVELNELLQNDYYYLDVMYMDNNAVGYVFYAKFDFLWVDYLAVFPKYQSRGIGKIILENLFKKFSKLRGCYFEVEKENPDDLCTKRRINFYEKAGCDLTGFKYYFPNDLKLLEMNLFYRKLSCGMPDNEKIFKDVERIFSLLHANTKNTNFTLKLIDSENKIK